MNRDLQRCHDGGVDAAQPEEAAPGDRQPRWLEGIEVDAWLGLIGVIIRLPAALDAQLQRDAGLSHFEYIVMVNLSNAEGRAADEPAGRPVPLVAVAALARRRPARAARLGAARPGTRRRARHDGHPDRARVR